MNGYLIVICIMLVMFAGLAIVIVQPDDEELRLALEPDNHNESESTGVESDEAMSIADAEEQAAERELFEKTPPNEIIFEASEREPG